MKKKRLFTIFTIVVLFAIIAVGVASAEDGVLFRRNVSKTPEGETEKSAIFMMDFYVPAQSSDGVVGPVDNYTLDDDAGTMAYEARDFAKPLVTVYIDDIGHTDLPEVLENTIMGGITFGEFDAFAGISLDDGTTWKITNLSRSADLSSFNLENGHAYPGDVHNVQVQVAGDRIFVAWASKYCEGGTPLYSLDPVDDGGYFAALESTYGKDALYLYDFFSVAGSQKSVNYTLQGFPEVGEIPYSCIWTARGKLLAGDDPATTDAAEASYVMWTKPERLTSGVRDANLPAVDCASGAGCILIWQEDPEGLRPGQGLGPGEGWSGAIANAQTDIWYSYISYEDFDDVFVDPEDLTTGAVPMEEYLGETMPKPFVPMAMPVRITDNAMCKASGDTDPYCYIDFDTLDDVDHTSVQPLLDLTAPEEDADYCAASVPWVTPGGTTLQICQTEDGRVLNGRIASTRVRLNLKPYQTNIDRDGDGVDDKSAWLVMAYEETKALGDVCSPSSELAGECDPIDIGKDVWYHSFDMFDHDFIDQGGMLNQPAVCKNDEDDFCTDGVGAFYEIQTDELNGGDYYLTEIARRFALTTNSGTAAQNSDSGLSAMLIYKQGIINQGGPADIMLRRLVLPITTTVTLSGTELITNTVFDFDPAVDNPYAFENMDCAEWAYTDGNNPNYLKGVCLSPAISISSNTVIRCDGGNDNDTCASLFPVADDGSNPNPGDFPKVYEWRQCDGASAIEGCEGDNDLDDQSWENPYDVAKGHRGFLDGDVVMIMYAWSPNWNSNTVGNDHYNLYVRRSFDGGLTWTTTPASLGGAGTTYTEYYYGETIGDAVPVEWSYEAGEFEQGRNVSLLTGNRVTILDPRYSPTGGLKLYPTIKTDWLTNNGIGFEGLPYEDDAVRDPSKFFIVYETGDNTTVAVGEATPLDLYYSRGTLYGDVYETMDYTTPADDDVLDRWPWLENKADDLSGEAGMLANPGGTFMYVVWNQWKEEILPDGHELVYDSDMIFRRLLYLPDDSTLSVPPQATIAYVNRTILGITNDDVLLILGTARGFGPDGEIVDVEWTDTFNGVTTPIDDGDDEPKRLNYPVRNLQPGWHQFEFKAKDKGGRWSPGATIQVLISDTRYDAFLPAIVTEP